MNDVPVKEIAKCMKRPETKVFNKRGLHRKRVEQMFLGSGCSHRSGSVRTPEQSLVSKKMKDLLRLID